MPIFFSHLTCHLVSLLCCSRDVPIHLWDAYTGTISSSYIAENNVYELVSARSVRFMRNGSKIIAGYEKFLCIFDLSRPGKYGQYVCEFFLYLFIIHMNLCVRCRRFAERIRLLFRY